MEPLNISYELEQFELEHSGPVVEKQQRFNLLFLLPIDLETGPARPQRCLAITSSMYSATLPESDHTM